VLSNYLAKCQFDCQLVNSLNGNWSYYKREKRKCYLLRSTLSLKKPDHKEEHPDQGEYTSRGSQNYRMFVLNRGQRLSVLHTVSAANYPADR
jgi:hypothetical protein